jgi:hypothetical protein
MWWDTNVLEGHADFIFKVRTMISIYIAVKISKSRMMAEKSSS